MIVGSATLTISHATVVLALQEYFDKRSADGYHFCIEKVKANSTYDNPEFTVNIKMPESEMAKIAEEKSLTVVPKI